MGGGEERSEWRRASRARETLVVHQHGYRNEATAAEAEATAAEAEATAAERKVGEERKATEEGQRKTITALSFSLPQREWRRMMASLAALL